MFTRRLDLAGLLRESAFDGPPRQVAGEAQFWRGAPGLRGS